MWNVVVVDNDVRSVETLVKMVDLAGKTYRVTEVFGNGEEAYEYLCKNPFRIHILIVEICIPRLSGLELIQKVRCFDKDMKCIIISNYKVFEYAQQAVRLQVSSYLLKPLDKEHLIKLLLFQRLQQIC